MSARVSIVIVTWNGRQHLEECLPALAAQTFPEFEVVVVDNGSDDGTVEWLNAQEIVPVRVVALAENRGFAGGNVEGWKSVDPEVDLVVFLNNDTAPEPGWLGELVRAADADLRRGAIASLMVDWAGETIDSAGDGIRVTGRGYQRFHGRGRSEAPSSGAVFSACAGAALYRQRMLEEVGFFDERFFMNGEDTDLCFRARLAGWSVWYCAEAVVRHRVSASQGAGSVRSVFYNHRNHIWSTIKCMPARLLLKYSWVFALDLFARAVFYAKRRRFIPWIRGTISGIGGMKTFWLDRKRIQAARRVPVRNIDCFLMYPSHLGGIDQAEIAEP